MMSTGSHLVRVAHRSVTVVATVNDARRLVVAVNCRWYTTIAAHVAQLVARGHVLCRKVSLLLTLATDTDAVSHRLDGTERPTRTAVRLIPDLLQAWAVSGTRIRAPIELFWKI